jgi:hypothetical protein
MNRRTELLSWIFADGGLHLIACVTRFRALFPIADPKSEEDLKASALYRAIWCAPFFDK